MMPQLAVLQPQVRRSSVAAKLAGVLSFAAAQVVVQGIGFAVGLLLVRVLPVDEYAFYVLATSMVGIAGVMLDLGLGNAVLSQGGQLLDQPKRMAALLADAFALQRRLVLWVLPVLIVAFVAMFARHLARPGQIALWTALVAACALLQLRSSLSLSVLRLHGERPLQQKLDLGINAAKLALVALLASTALNTTVALALNAAAAATLCTLVHRWLARRLPALPSPDGTFRPSLAALVRRQTPNSLYYSLSGQITIWLVGLLGSTQGMAEVGALGRLAAVFTVVGTVMAAIVQPFFARRHEPRVLVPAFVAVNAFFALAALTLWAGARLFPDEILWILGGSYRGLQEAVPWMVLASSLSAWSGAVYSIGSARGWLVPPAWVIVTGLLGIAGCVAGIDVSTAAGAFKMASVTSGIATVVVLAHVTRQLARHARLCRMPVHLGADSA